MAIPYLYLSISPKTMSTVPIIVTRSANCLFFINLGKNWMWLYAGDRILHLYGLFVPSPIKVTPNSPLGDSTYCVVIPLSTVYPRDHF